MNPLTFSTVPGIQSGKIYSRENKISRKKNWSSLAIDSLHTELQAQVLLWIHHPVVTGGRYVKHQPAPIRCLDIFGVKQERLCISGGKKRLLNGRPD